MKMLNSKIVDRYLFSQVFAAAFVAVLLFVIVWISPEILFRIIRQAVYGEISPEVAFQLFFLEIPEVVGKVIPIGILLGTLFVFDKLSRNFELVILRSIGISFLRVVMPVTIISAMAAFVCFYTYDNFIPYSTNKIKEIKHHVSNEQFVYLDKDNVGKPNQAIIVSSFDGKNIMGLNVLQFAENVSYDTPLMKNILTADRATYDNGKWVLDSGTIYKVSPDGIYEEIKEFSDIEILSGLKGEKAYKLMYYSAKKHDEMDIKGIKKYLTLLKSEELMDEYRYMLNKLYQRYSQAFSCIVLAIAGVVLGWSKPRQNRILGFTIGAGIIFGYYIIIPFLDLLAEKGILHPIATAWLPVFLIVLGIFFYTKNKDL